MKLNLKFKIIKNKLKFSNDKNGYLIENITSKPSYVVFLQPIYVKNKFITIKNYIDNYNNTDIKIKVLNRNKTILAETIPNSELELINKYKLVFVGITVPANSKFLLKNIEIEFSDNNDYLISEVEKEKRDMLLILPTYPYNENKYNCAYFHNRYKEYIANKISIKLLVVTNKNYNYKYIYDGIEVNCISYYFLRKHLETTIYKKILIHFFNESYAQVLEASKILNTKIYLYCHGAEILYRDRNKICKQYFSPDYKINLLEEESFKVKDDLFRKWNNKENVEFVFVSEFLKDRSEELLNIKFNKFHIIPNQINEDIFKYKKKDIEQRKKICMIRSFHNLDSYSIDTNVKVILELSKKDYFKELEFCIYGKGEMHDILLKPIEKFTNVKIINEFLSFEDMNKMYQENGISLFASRYDTQGVSTLESAMVGTIPLVSKNTGLSNFLQENNINYSEVDDYISMANIIEYFYLNPLEFLRVSEECHNEVLKKCGTKETLNRDLKLITQDQNYTYTSINKKQDKDILLSIIVPAYNCEKWISNGIYSLLNHKLSNRIEVIVVNDGSKDNTYKIAYDLTKIFKSLKVIDKENGGHGSTINVGLKSARGKYVRLMDGDDYFLTDNFTKFLEHLEQEDSDIVLTDYVEDFSIDNIKVEVKNYDNFIPFQKNYLNLMSYEGYGFKKWGPLLSTATYKLDNIKKYNFLIDEKCFYVDMEYNFITYIASSTIVYYPITIYNYYLGRQGQSVSPESWKKNYKNHEKVIFRLIDELYTNYKDIEKYKRDYIMNNLIVPLVEGQYRIVISLFKNNKEFKNFDFKLKKYPEVYNQKYSGKSIYFHRKLFNGLFIPMVNLAKKLLKK